MKPNLSSFFIFDMLAGTSRRQRKQLHFHIDIKLKSGNLFAFKQDQLVLTCISIK